MRCCDVEALWDELRIMAPEAAESRREHVLEHLRSCAHCQELYRENEGVAYCLACLPIVEPPPSLVPKIIEHIASLRQPGRHGGPPDGLGAMSSPLGPLYVAFRANRITAIVLDQGETPVAIQARIERRLRRYVLPAELPDCVRGVIETYFRIWSVDLEDVDISTLTPFEQAALGQAAQIPPGEVRSYGWIAQALGRPHAARAVGQAMARNPVPLLYPCHRVVNTDGDLHDYGYGIEMKRRILSLEGYRKGKP
jgi:methylated-DNA-[protein]-cysteine S-methyltransferase